MADSLPSTSSYVIAGKQYEIDQLAKAIHTAASDKGKQSHDDAPPTPNCYHLHTCTLDISLLTPEREMQYWCPAEGYTTEPNVAFTFFAQAREELISITDPLVPFTICAPSADIVRLPRVDAALYPGDGLSLYLPNAGRREELAWVPALPSASAKDWIPGSTAWDMQHWLHTAMALDPAIRPTRQGTYRDAKKRVHLSTSLQVCWIPDESGASTDAELKLIVTIKVYLDMALLFDPLPEVGNDMLGFILYSLIPSPTAAHHAKEAEERAAGLRSFYACLKPAPDLPFGFHAQILQPKEMVSQLLPFQARTVKMLLEREQAGGRGADEGGGGSERRKDPKGFWSGLDLGDKYGKVGYRRVTGDVVKVEPHQSPGGSGKGKERAHDESESGDVVQVLSSTELDKLPTLLDLSGVRGTMLCEEMGLGKTVETIALMLLHRHPLSTPRDFSTLMTKSEAGPSQASVQATHRPVVPTIDLRKGPPGLDIDLVGSWVKAEQAAFAGREVWDAQVELNVTEVATTLIVAPSSLLKQWVSEMQRHAPALRICVYDGWKALQAGIRKERDARMRVQARREMQDKKRKAEEFRNQTRRKYAKGHSGNPIKLESGDEDDDGIEEAESMAAGNESRDDEEGTLQITQRQFVEYVRAHDVVVTTYHDLSQDLKVALPAPSRSRRSTAKYQLNERPRSPLVMVEWWRVVMDEVQLQGDTTAAANMVSLIPRKNSLAVSGTPAKSDIKDLMGSLKFLRVPVLPFDSRLWHRLQNPSMRPAFEGLFRSIAVRTTKKEVAGEFNLPHQSRFVVPIELSEIELHYYDDTLYRSRERLRLPAPGEARPEDWVLDRALFQVVLRTLRQICTHIQVGQMHAPGAGGRLGGDQRLRLGRNLMTMGEALKKMQDDHMQEVLLESRQQLRMMVRQAQLTVLDELNDLRYLEALGLYERVRKSAIKLLGPVRQHFKNLLGGREDSDEQDGTPDRIQSQQEREKAQALTAARISIREISIILHEAWFFEGDVRHVQKEEDLEVNCYAEADNIRKEILARPLQNANTSMELLRRSMRTAAIEDISELQTTDIKREGGLLSNDTFKQANDLLKILNDNAVLVFNWRSKIIDLLSSPIDAEPAEAPEGQGQDVENPEAEYYAEALKAQGEVEAYMIAYAAAVADRREFMSETRSLLAAHDARVTKQRSTKAALNAMVDVELADVPDDVSEQAAVLMTERQAFRDARLEKGCERPLKGLLMDLNAIIHGPHRPEEIKMAQDMATMLKGYINKQSEYVDKLNKELDLFRATFNRRVQYFAALQEISDSVSAPEFRDLGKDIEAASREVNELEVKLAKMMVKGRYLQYLGTKQHEDEDIREDCIICFGSSDDTEAVLLPCGHYFCLSCYKEFRKTPGGRRCPSCRTDIDSREITRIKLNPQRIEHPGASAIVDAATASHDQSESQMGATGLSIQEELVGELSSEEQEMQRRQADLDRLRMMDVKRWRQVMQMDMLGEYGSKINFLVKHLLHYKSREPDARHVIFSNWSDSLNIVMQALRQNRISFLSFDQGKNQKDVVDQFLKDETISVFLLHAERESSGLTLTSCRVVHLLEPVLRHSFELQAIGRVDRLGQDKETTVFCYATMDTVESRILSQGVRTGTSIYLADEQEGEHVVAEMPNVASAAHKGGDVAAGANEEDLLGLIM